MDALPIIPNSVGRYPTYLKGAPLWSLTTDRLGGWTLWRYNVHSSSIAIVIFKTTHRGNAPRFPPWQGGVITFIRMSQKDLGWSAYIRGVPGTDIFKIESFKSLLRIPVSLMSEILTGLRYCCINRLTLTWFFRRITQKEVCNPLNRFLNFL